jgi:hypothetical protein
MDIQQKKQHWKNVFEQQQSRGLSIVKFCRDNKINILSFYTLRNRLIPIRLNLCSSRDMRYISRKQLEDKLKPLDIKAIWP